MNPQEIQVFRNGFYSRYEKIDECYARRRAPEIGNQGLRELKSLVSSLCSTLEDLSPTSDEWHLALQHLYALTIQDDAASNQLIHSLLFEVGALGVLGQAIYCKLEDLDNIKQGSPREAARFRVELELRQSLNLLFTFIIGNITEEEALRAELIQPEIICLEEICMKAIKQSIDLQMVPVRKFLVLFQVYLRFCFGREPVEADIKSHFSQKVSNLKYTKELA